MTVVAADPSKDCGLDVYADSIWIGGGCEGLGMVFKGTSMGDNVRTPEDTEKLKKLEKRLVDLKFVTTAELDVLCSSSFLDHMEEPYEMVKLPTTYDFPGSRIVELVAYWKRGGEHDRLHQEKRKARRDGAGTKVR